MTEKRLLNIDSHFSHCLVTFFQIAGDHSISLWMPRSFTTSKFIQFEIGLVITGREYDY